MSSTDSPDWGKGFSSSNEAGLMSNDGHEFSFYIAGYTPIGGDRENLETQPDRVLTDSELQNADVLVVHMSGIGYKVWAGPWNDWDMLYDEIGEFYDTYQETS